MRNILEKFLIVYIDVVFLTQTSFVLGKIGKPVRRGEVDRFGYVEAWIESAMIRGVKSDHEFSLLLYYFGYFDIGCVGFDKVRVYNNSFVP